MLSESSWPSKFERRLGRAAKLLARGRQEAALGELRNATEFARWRPEAIQEMIDFTAVFQEQVDPGMRRYLDRLCQDLEFLMERAAAAAGVEAEGSPYSVATVMDRFHEKTGIELHLESVLDLTRIGEGRSACLETSEKAWARLGEFHFHVELTPGEDDAQSLRRGVSPGEDPDADGVYWKHVHPEPRGRPFWAASTFRANVRLNWFPPSGAKGNTRQLRILLDVLDGLESPGDQGR